MLASVLADRRAARGALPPDRPLPAGCQPEGIAAGNGAIGYSGSRADGAVYRFNARTGKGRVLVTRPQGRGAYGLKLASGRLYVAGGPTGFLYVYDARTGSSVDAVDVDGGFVNDVDGDADEPRTSPTPRRPCCTPTRARAGSRRCSTSPATGSRWRTSSTRTGSPPRRTAEMLVLVQSVTGKLFTVDPTSGAANEIDLGGATVTNGDGLLLEGRRLYVVRNQNNEVAVVRLERGRDAPGASCGGSGTRTSTRRPPPRASAAGSTPSTRASRSRSPTRTRRYQVVRVG